MTKLIYLIAILLSLFLSKLMAQSNVDKHFYKGDYEKTLLLLNEKFDKDEATISDYQMAALCNEKMFNFQQAVQYYSKGLDLYPNENFLLEGLADVQLNLGLKNDAATGFRKLVEMDSMNIRYRGKLASILMDLNQYDEAKNIYQALYVADSSNVYFLRRLMQAKYKLQEYAYLIELALDNPYVPADNSEIQMLIADSYSKINDNNNALKTLSEILETDSMYLPALNKKAYIHFSAYRDYESAVPLYRKLNFYEKFSDPFHLKNLAICEFFTGNQHFAAYVLDSLTREIENDAFIPFYAGLSYNKIGEPDKALEFLVKAASMVIPDYTGDVYHHLGRAYAGKRRFDEALQTYQKVRMFDPNNYQVLYDIAITYEEYNLNRAAALGYYQLFVKECGNQRSADLKYAETRIKLIKEELFFEGD